MITLFVGTFVWLAWLTHARFGTFGFDLGIFDQGVWLLSRFRDPFVTIRGLSLFGDHTSYILVLVAPLYWVWADPRLLLQVVGLAIPAVSLYLIGTRRLHSPLAGLAVAAAYLAYPAVQWAAVWSFHPETLAAGFLGLAALAADRQRWRQMAAWLALALLCKEDVGLVVAGSTHHRQPGLRRQVLGGGGRGHREVPEQAGLEVVPQPPECLFVTAGGGDEHGQELVADHRHPPGTGFREGTSCTSLRGTVKRADLHPFQSRVCPTGDDWTPVVGPSAMRVRGGWRSRPWRSRSGSDSPERCEVGRC